MMAAVKGAWPVMGFSSHQQMDAGHADRVVGCSAPRPTSLASPVMAGPHHTPAVKYVGGDLRSGPV
jgi:hypothetical protein